MKRNHFLLYRFFFPPVLLLGAILFSAGGASVEGGDVLPADKGLPSALTSPVQEESPVFPLRRIFKEMGYEVCWEAENKRAVLTGRGRRIVLYPQNPLYSINGVVYRMARPPFLEGGRLMVDLEFVRQAAGVSELFWDEARDLLEISFKEDERMWNPKDAYPQGASEKCPTWFLEVLLPEENRAEIGESFTIEIGAPFVEGIHSYEVRFFFNPELIKVQDIKNPSYRESEEFCMKEINNREGIAEYTQTNLGFKADIPPRRTLVVLEAVGFSEGAVPLSRETLHVELQDNTATKIPAAVEEKTLHICAPR
ncbi:MAG: copper amine oxidase N-terminal domain-containing protein [Firmicutes bacterium]|nr:copper amine oxidase N-terminal domain-containing protein [Bacillota bacterium]